MEYQAYPMPEDLPDYPNHWQIAQYFDDYVDHFGFRDKITFRTEVVKVEPVPGRRHGYAVTVRGRNEHGEPTEPETLTYEHVIVANGHHWDPRWPEPSFPGAEDFPGVQMHAHYYKTPEIFAGQARAGAGHRQLRDRHRGGVLTGRGAHLPRDAPRRAHRAEVRLRRPHRPPHRLGRRPDARGGAAAVDGGDAPADPGQGHRLRAAAAGPRRAARAPDRQRRPAHPARPRRHHRAAQHRPLRGLEGLLRRRIRPRGRRRRLLHRLQGQLPVPRRPGGRARRTTTSTSTAASSTPTTRACTSSA